MESSNLLGDALAGVLRPIVVEAVETALNNQRKDEDERLLTIGETVAVMSVSKDWLYAHGEKHGLRRKLGPKLVRYSWKAIQKFIATRGS